MQACRLIKALVMTDAAIIGSFMIKCNETFIAQRVSSPKSEYMLLEKVAMT